MRILLLWLFLGVNISVFGQSIKTLKSILYASTPEKELMLDLYLPEQVSNPYLIIWVHGGAWHSGSKESPPLELLKKGYALASISYRRSVESKFPAQIHDIKAAVRFLRAHASKYEYRADKIFLWGSSAGGHLAALTGLTNNHIALEGNIGHDLTTSSTVQGVIDFYGPTDLTTIISQSTSHGTNVRIPALALLFGKPMDQSKEELKLASPVFHVTSDDPPLFICHGDMDIQVPINQSIQLYGKYKEMNLPVQFEFVYGAAHGGIQYRESKLIDKVDLFLKSIL